MLPPGAAARHPPIAICTIGDLILDVVVLPNAPLVSDGDTPATIRLSPGGQAANVAAWAVALGARSRLVCKRATDTASELATADVAALGVEICGPVVSGRGGVVVSVRDTDGHRTMTSDRGMAAELAPAELDPSWVEDCDVLHVSGYCLLREPMAEAAIEAARRASRVSVDLASAHDIELVGASRFASRLKRLDPDIVFATESERAAVPDLETAWVIKHGPGGATFPEGFHPAPPGDVIDTTGAGDALAAGYLVGGPEVAMDAAARCVSMIGAMPSRASVSLPRSRRPA